MRLINLLANNNYIVLNKDLIHKIGIDETILLGELCSECSYWEMCCAELDDWYFYSTIENVEKNTTFGSKKQKRLLDRLVELNIVDVKLKGVPAKRHIRINEQTLYNLLKNK